MQLYNLVRDRFPWLWHWARDHCGENRLATWIWVVLLEWDWQIMWQGLRCARFLLVPDIAQYIMQKPFTWKKFFCRLANHPYGPSIYALSLDPEGPCMYCEDIVWQ